MQPSNSLLSASFSASALSRFERSSFRGCACVHSSFHSGGEAGVLERVHTCVRGQAIGGHSAIRYTLAPTQALSMQTTIHMWTYSSYISDGSTPTNLRAHQNLAQLGFARNQLSSTDLQLEIRPIISAVLIQMKFDLFCFASCPRGPTSLSFGSRAAMRFTTVLTCGHACSAAYRHQESLGLYILSLLCL